MPVTLHRRHFLAASMAGATGLLGVPAAFAADERLETTTVRLAKKTPVVCNAPQYIADDLLRAEGFTQIEFVPSGAGRELTKAISGNTIDFSMGYAGPNIIAVDAGDNVVNLAGVHVGCFELFAHDGVNSVFDLKGKKVAIAALQSSDHIYVSAMLAYVGLDPRHDVIWVPAASPPPHHLFADHKVDAFLGFAPIPQELRARKIGHVIVNSATDPPWSQYFCCMLLGNREFVRKYPVATKRVLRAVLKAADLCVSQPAVVVRQLVDRKFTDHYDYALQALNELPYDKWREFDAEDTIRFYALKLREVGLVKATPDQIIADGTDWRFLNQLKQELKA